MGQIVITTENAAMEVLVPQCAIAIDPILDETADVRPILQKCARAAIWTPATPYTFGFTVQPTAAKRNGNRFVLVRFDGQGISSGATEPFWPRGRHSLIQDGNCFWEARQPDFDCLWDIRLAAYLCWDLKVQRASCRYDFKVADSSESVSQLLETLRQERDRFLPVVIG